MSEDVEILQNSAVAKVNKDAIDLRAELGESFYNLLMAVDARVGETLLADITSEEGWNRLFDLYDSFDDAGNRKVSREDIVEFMKISHARVFPEWETGIDAKAILNKAVKRNLRGKVGKKLISNLLETLTTLKLLPESTSDNSSGITSEQISNTVIDSLNSFTSWDVIEDRVEDITLQEVLNCLDEMLRFDDLDCPAEIFQINPFNPFVRQIFDIGKRFRFDRQQLITYYVIYTVSHGKPQVEVINQKALKPVSEDERQITKWCITENVTDEMLDLIEEKVLKLNEAFMKSRFNVCRNKKI